MIGSSFPTEAPAQVQPAVPNTVDVSTTPAHRCQDGEAMVSTARRQVVSRRCRVCEWEGERIESAEADTDCPWCHAPSRVVRAVPLVERRLPVGVSVHAAALGRRGGLKGGRARAAALSADRRRQIAQMAARARWSRRAKGEGGDTT
jgi:hypothetical protein